MSAISDHLRADLARQRENRAAKLQRVFAKPEDLTRSGKDVIINPRGEAPDARALREAKEEAKAARAAADKLKP
jgi:hypothetical protein